MCSINHQDEIRNRSTKNCVDNTNYETTNYGKKGAQEESQQNGVHQEVVRPPCSAGYKCGVSV